MSWQTLFQLPAAQRNAHRIHLVGIGGTGLAPIARVLLEMGFRVSGSDRQSSVRTDELAKLGADVFMGHEPGHLWESAGSPDLVLISSAIPGANPEVQAALGAGIPVVKRSDLLGPLTSGRTVIAVAGAHGKTTTTGMIAHILVKAGQDPGYIIGSHVPGLGMSAAGRGRHFVVEADEYDYAFLGLNPDIIVITNLDWDHPDCFPTAAAYADAFRCFLQRLTPDGQVIYCGDDLQLRSLCESFPMSRYSYGIRHNNDWLAQRIEMQPAETSYNLGLPSGADISIHLAVPGLHNVLNSAAALMAAHLAQVPLADGANALASFRGADRRFEIRGEVAGVLIVDDYAHHPTEVRTTLAAARAAYPDRDMWAIYQPHTFSRTRTFLDQFEGVFDPANYVIVTDIYAAREPIDPYTTPAQVIAASRHPHAQSISTLSEIADYLQQHVQPHSLVIILSAGDATQLAPLLLARLATQEPVRIATLA